MRIAATQPKTLARHTAVLLWLWLLLCVPRLAASESLSPAAQIRVYMHDIGVTPPLSAAALRSIFTMRLTLWPDGSRIQVLVLQDDHPLHRQFSKSVLGLFPYQLRQTWDRGVFSGTGKAPTQVDSETEMLQMLKTTPGAIGYLIQQQTLEGIHLVERL